MPKRKPKRENISGISPNSPMSYENYLKSALQLISPHLSVRVYKLAPKEEYTSFIRGKDLRIQIYWKKESKFEFIVEQAFWYQSNRNKEDREYMRDWADLKVKMIQDAMERGKKAHESKIKVKKKTKKNTKKKVKKTAIGSTQNKFEEMKRK
tara:strand:+ start:19 stop:474 length:456 start_codon:yes stop_codon:yes gene_type:complete